MLIQYQELMQHGRRINRCHQMWHFLMYGDGIWASSVGTPLWELVGPVIFLPVSAEPNWLPVDMMTG